MKIMNVQSIMCYCILYTALFCLHIKIKEYHHINCSRNILTYYMMKDSLMCVHLHTYTMIIETLLFSQLDIINKNCRNIFQFVSMKIT